MKKRVILMSVLASSSVFMIGCQEDTTVDSVAGIELSLIENVQANVFGTPRSNFKASNAVVPGRDRDLSLGVHYNDHTYIDDVYRDYGMKGDGPYVLNNWPREVDVDRNEGYVCAVLGECD